MSPLPRSPSLSVFSSCVHLPTHHKNAVAPIQSVTKAPWCSSARVLEGNHLFKGILLQFATTDYVWGTYFPPNTEWAVSLGDGIKQRQMRPLRSLVCLSVSSFTIRKREKVVNLIDPKAAARTTAESEAGMDMQNVALLAGFLGQKLRFG